jgi:ribosomal protein L22
MFKRLGSILIRSSVGATRSHIRAQPFHTSLGLRNSNPFGELTKTQTTPVVPSQSTSETSQDEEVTVENDAELQKYHTDEALKAQVRSDKYITPLKAQLFQENVAQNGFFKNNQIIKHDGKVYQLSLTEKEIEILEPSIYLSSYRIKSSMKKATQVNRFVRGYTVKNAINQLHFNDKKMATELEQLLKRGLEQANKLNLDEDTMYIDALWVGSDGEWRKRIDIKGRSRHGIIKHPYIHLKVILKSHQTKLRKQWETQQKELQSKPRMFLNNEPLNFKVRPNYKW